MRIVIAALVSAGIVASGATASAQAPAPLPPPGPGAAPAPGWPPPPQPGPAWTPPPAPPPTPGGAITPGWPAPPPLAFTPAPPPPQSPPSSPEPARADAPIDLAHRVGFGLGFWVAPGGLGGGSAGALGGLGALDGGGAHYGGVLGIRWWVRDRVVLIPSLILGVNRRTIPDSDQSNTTGGTFTEGTFAPSLSVGYAAYRGKTSRFVLSAGLGFWYEVGDSPITVSDDSGNYHQQFVPARYVSFEVPVGFSFEQFFSSKISMALGGGAPLFAYSRGQIDTRAAQTSIGANFAMAQLSASVQLYTD